MTADLGEFLAERLAWPRRAGEWDCCAFPAAWAMACGFADPMAEYRGAYASEAEAEGILARAGGLAPLFGPGLVSVGAVPLEPSSDPRKGDIGIIDLLGNEAGAIYTGRRWAFVAERGLGFVSVERGHVSQIWRLGGG